MSLDSLNLRLNYHGGKQKDRMKQDKIRGLFSANNFAYQAETAILSNNKEFKCLINSNKLSEDLDDKIISIPYKSIELTGKMKGKTIAGLEEVGLKPGEVFTWKETNTHWLVYLQKLTETAYFLANIRRCKQQIEINHNLYWVSIRNTSAENLDWHTSNKITFNDLNYSLSMLISKNEETLNFFHRFTKVKVKEADSEITKSWKVASVNPYFGDGVIEVFLEEDYENTILEKRQEEIENTPKPPEQDKTRPYIEGPLVVKCYSKPTYKVINANGGKWILRYKDKEQIFNTKKTEIDLSITIGEMGKFLLIYRRENQEDISIEVKMEAF